MILDKPFSRTGRHTFNGIATFSLEQTLLILLLLAYGVYAGLFIARVSFVVSGQRYFVLFDDSMISMRYAKNLADGHGLVWNPGGERVEGYSNLLWVLIMAGIHFLPTPLSKTSLVVQGLGAILLALNLIWVRKIVGRIPAASGGRHAAQPSVWLIAVILTGFYFPLNYWGWMGAEVSLLTLIASISVLEVLKTLETGQRPVALYLLFVVGMLTRDDMLPFFLACLCFLFIACGWKFWRQALIGAAILAALVAAHTAFRWFYYGEILPNTYYLKLTGYPLILRAGRGLFTFLGFSLRMNLALLLVPAAIALMRRERRLALLGLLCAVQAAYSIYVGGDAWEWYGWSNRYLSIVMPLLFILFAFSLVSLVEKWRGARSRRSARTAPGKPGNKFILPGLALVLLVSLNAYDGLASLRQAALLAPAPEVEGLQLLTELGLHVRAITSPQAKVALTWAGAAPYLMERYTIDMHGKNDRRIAHKQMVRPDKEMPLYERLNFFLAGSPEV
jgi:hypothetical protein